MATANTPAPTSNQATTGGSRTSGSSTIGRGFDNANKYVMSEYSYPNDLFASVPGQATADTGKYKTNNAYNSYVVFYINVTEESRISKNNRDIVVGTVDRADQNTLQNGAGGEARDRLRFSIQARNDRPKNRKSLSTFSRENCAL